MRADDYDDINEGTNAKLIYSIEKNAIEEDSGAPIFEINPHTGVIKTSVCCLDREKTPDYSLQIVATDGGGLKGTGTASIKVTGMYEMKIFNSLLLIDIHSSSSFILFYFIYRFK